MIVKSINFLFTCAIYMYLSCITCKKFIHNNGIIMAILYKKSAYAFLSIKNKNIVLICTFIILTLTITFWILVFKSPNLFTSATSSLQLKRYFPFYILHFTLFNRILCWWHNSLAQPPRLTTASGENVTNWWYENSIGLSRIDKINKLANIIKTQVNDIQSNCNGYTIHCGHDNCKFHKMSSYTLPY